LSLESRGADHVGVNESEHPHEVQDRRLLWFLRTMDCLASGMAELSEVLHGRAESLQTESEILRAIVQARRRARVLSQPWTTKKPRRNRADEGGARRRGGPVGDQPILDVVRKVGRYESEIATWPSIFDAMLDLSQRVVLAQHWDVAMGVLYEEAFFIDPKKPIEERELARAWAIRTSILGNGAVADAIAATAGGISQVMRMIRQPRDASDARSKLKGRVIKKVLTFSEMPEHEGIHVCSGPPEHGDVRITPEEDAVRMEARPHGALAKKLWRTLSIAWMRTPHRSFTSDEACGVFGKTVKSVDGGPRRTRDHLCRIKADGKPILIKTRSGRAPIAYYLVNVLESKTDS
jgi:hypothetical protein